MLADVSRWAFWSAAAVLLYIHVGFPLLLAIWARLRPRPYRRDDNPRPVSVVLAAHDEADVIGARIENLLALDYPPELLQVIVACDGRGDGTYEVARAHATRQVEVLSLERTGKAGAMNAAIRHVRHDIVAFTDANTVWEAGALRALVAPFADPDVGGTAGDQVYAGSERTDQVAGGEATYWSFDRYLKLAESRIGSVVSATGAIYALRREHVEEVPSGVTDDFFLSTGAILAGRRLVFVPGARAHETIAPSREAEFSRKVRIMTRGLRSVQARGELLGVRRYGVYAVQLFTHKVLRRLAFVPLMVMAVSSVVGAPADPVLRVAAIAQGAFYGSAVVGLLLPRTHGGLVGRILRLPAFYCLVYVAAAVAVIRILRGTRVDRWDHERLAGSGQEDIGHADRGGGSSTS